MLRLFKSWSGTRLWSLRWASKTRKKSLDMSTPTSIHSRTSEACYSDTLTSYKRDCQESWVLRYQIYCKINWAMNFRARMKSRMSPVYILHVCGPSWRSCKCASMNLPKSWVTTNKINWAIRIWTLKNILMSYRSKWKHLCKERCRK